MTELLAPHDFFFLFDLPRWYSCLGRALDIWILESNHLYVLPKFTGVSSCKETNAAKLPGHHEDDDEEEEQTVGLLQLRWLRRFLIDWFRLAPKPFPPAGFSFPVDLASPPSAVFPAGVAGSHHTSAHSPSICSALRVLEQWEGRFVTVPLITSV